MGPSRYTSGGDFEGFGIAAVEAALCGLPAVVASGAGLAEAVSDGHTGLCVPPEDPGSTARAIVSLLVDGALRRRMGEAARSRAEREQTWPKQVGEYDSRLGSDGRFRSRSGHPTQVEPDMRLAVISHTLTTTRKAGSSDGGRPFAR